MNLLGNLSEHFTLSEGVNTSHKEFNNTPTAMQLANMCRTADSMEVVRAVLGNKPIKINSWFRCLDLNRELKSRDTSDHLLGCAVDFTCPSFGTPFEVCRELIKFQDAVKFKQLILEHTWIHISWDSDPSVLPKLQVLSLLNTGTYAIGLTDAKGKYYVV